MGFVVHGHRVEARLETTGLGHHRLLGHQLFRPASLQEAGDAAK